MTTESTLPDYIKIINKVEMYSPGDVLALYYRFSLDAMYKFPGAIFGISTERALDALQRGDAKPYHQKS